MRACILVVFLFACDSGQRESREPSNTEPAAAPAPAAPPTSKWQTPVLATELACATDDDCQYVDTKCNDCCAHAPIAKVHVPAWTERRRKTCEGYTGPVCDCDTPWTVPRCRDGKCALDRRANP